MARKGHSQELRWDFPPGLSGAWMEIPLLKRLNTCPSTKTSLQLFLETVGLMKELGGFLFVNLFIGFLGHTKWYSEDIPD